MKNNNEKATIREVFQLLEEVRKELSTSISRLEMKFDTLEAGRLSNLEARFANLSGKLSIIAAVVSMIISISVTLLNRFF